jgi:glycosyltransferase involved in cell wall biosynthesis
LNGLRRAGLEVIPFSYATTDPTYPFFRDKPPGLVILNNSPVGRINPVLSFARTLRSLLKATPELVLTCGYERPESLAAVVYCRLLSASLHRARARCVLMVENVSESRRRKFTERVKALYLRTFDGFLVGGKRHAAYLHTLGVSTDKVAGGYNCVDNDRVERLVGDVRRRNMPPIPAPYLLTVSRLIDRKNTVTILRAFGDYVRSVPANDAPFNLIIAGDGPERPRLEELGAALRVSELVHFTGELAGLEEVAYYYAFATAFVLASWFEPWGLVINEAMAAGLPIVASSQIVAATDLVEEGVNGFTFDAHARGDLAVIFRRLHDTRATLPELGKAGRSIIRRFSPDVFGANAAGFLDDWPSASATRSS